MQTISPVSNLLTLLALCAIAVGAYLRARGGRPYGRDQFLGALLVIAGTGVSIWLEYLLRLQIGLPPGEEMAQPVVLVVWFVGWMTSTVGFIVFAWGYVSEALEGAATGAKGAPPDS